MLSANGKELKKGNGKTALFDGFKMFAITAKVKSFAEKLKKFILYRKYANLTLN